MTDSERSRWRTIKLDMDTVEEIKNRLAVEDVIGEYVQLKRAGRNFRGLSPFTSEKTPSFMVSPEKQIWHDFSSNKGGNIFSFVMEMEGVDFKEALELLARKAGVDLAQMRSTKRSGGVSKERLYEANDRAAKFYQTQLAANNEALAYAIRERGLSKSTLLQWKLGYSPNQGRALVSYLTHLGFSDAEIKSAGLATSRSDALGDMFRGRLMIPLHDPQGRIIGFTARLLAKDGYGPKYINTPQTSLYDKSRHIFGLHFAKQAIREQKFALITEGNLDVISSHQAGVNQVVATAGTALTEWHLKGLSRFTSDIRLCFDADKAGVGATERAIAIASRLKISLGIVDIRLGKDPDELIRKDPKLWERAIETRAYAVDWLIKTQSGRFDLGTAQGKREFSDAVMPVIRQLDDPVEKDHYLNKLADILDVSKESLADKLGRSNSSDRVLKRNKVSTSEVRVDQIEIAKCEDHLLSLMISRRSLRSSLKVVKSEMLTRQPAKQLLGILREDPGISSVSLAGLDKVGEYVKILLLQYEELYQGLEPSELRYEAARLQTRLIAGYVKEQKLNIAKELQTADDQNAQKLLEQARRLDKLLRVNQGESINA